MRRNECTDPAGDPLALGAEAADRLRSPPVASGRSTFSAVAHLADASPSVRIAGAGNAVRAREDGALEGDMFDGEGFGRGVRRKGVKLAGARAPVVGCGGVGGAIVASLARAGVGSPALSDARDESTDALGGRVRSHYPDVAVTTGGRDPDGFDIVVNATPTGMEPGNPRPMDVTRRSPDAFVGEAVLNRRTPSRAPCGTAAVPEDPPPPIPGGAPPSIAALSSPTIKRRL